jgi:hypothetical protein
VSLEDRLVPAGRPLPFPVLFAGAGSGSGLRVRVLGMNLVLTLRVGTQGPDAPRRVSAEPSPISGDLGDFFAFPADLRTGVTVGTDWKAGDVTADGVPDFNWQLAVALFSSVYTRVNYYGYY